MPSLLHAGVLALPSSAQGRDPLLPLWLVSKDEAVATGMLSVSLPADTDACVPLLLARQVLRTVTCSVDSQAALP